MHISHMETLMRIGFKEIRLQMLLGLVAFQDFISQIVQVYRLS